MKAKSSLINKNQKKESSYKWKKMLMTMDADEPPSKPNAGTIGLSDKPKQNIISITHPNKYFKLSKKQIELPPKINRNRLSIIKRIQKGNIYSPIGISEKNKKYSEILIFRKFRFEMEQLALAG